MTASVTPFPRAAMKNTPPSAGPAQPAHTHADVPQHIRNNASTLHRLASTLHGAIGGHAATPTVLDRAEDDLIELAERALALRNALVAERKRLAGVIS
jgi:hypothetical protein